jgi:hypothetical protein
MLTERALHSTIDGVSIDAAASLKELEEALAREPDPETMRAACQEMDRLREEIRKRVGTVDVAVEFVRDARDR